MSDRARALFTAVALFMSAIGANAQQPTPPAGSPGATKPLSGQQLPAPPTPFGGKIERNAAESTPYWAPRVVPPKGAPNVLLVMIDDEGYGASSRIHTQRILSLTEDLPVAIVIVDTEDSIRGFLPELDELVGEGLIIIDPVEVVRYVGRNPEA